MDYLIRIVDLLLLLIDPNFVMKDLDHLVLQILDIDLWNHLAQYFSSERCIDRFGESTDQVSTLLHDFQFGSLLCSVGLIHAHVLLQVKVDSFAELLPAAQEFLVLYIWSDYEVDQSFKKLLDRLKDDEF